MHEHEHQHIASHQTLFLSVGIIGIFAIIEAFTGFFAHSLVLLGDAGHMVADTVSLSIAAIAAWLAKKPASLKHSYGLGRIEVIVASISSTFLLFISFAIAFEAILRLFTPEHVLSLPMIVVATIGLIINIIVAWVLHRGEKTLNTEAALLHVLSDLLGSIIAILSGTIIYFTGLSFIDPLLSLVMCALIFFGAFRILKRTFNVLMESTPKKYRLEHIGKTLAKIDNVTSVHDLHVWTLSSNRCILTAHVVIDNLDAWPNTLAIIKTTLKNNFGIDHITIQAEIDEAPISFEKDQH